MGSFNSIGGETFTVTFGGSLANTAGLSTLVSNAPSHHAPTITHDQFGAAPAKTYQAIFLGSFAQSSQPTLTAATTGNTIINPPSTIIQGGSANATPQQWFSNSQGGSLTTSQSSTISNGSTTVTITDVTRVAVGMTVSGTGIPAGAKIVSINAALSQITLSLAATATATQPLLFTGSTATTNAVPYVGATSVTENLSGSVTDLVVDPTDSDMIYAVTAGGGAWRSQDGGVSWVPLFDQQFALANPAVMFGGAITLDPNHVGNIYYGTGNANDATDSFAGGGIYVSHDFGATWSLMTDPRFGNPFAARRHQQDHHHRRHRPDLRRGLRCTRRRRHPQWRSRLGRPAPDHEHHLVGKWYLPGNGAQPSIRARSTGRNPGRHSGCLQRHLDRRRRQRRRRGYQHL